MFVVLRNTNKENDKTKKLNNIKIITYENNFFKPYLYVGFGY